MNFLSGIPLLDLTDAVDVVATAIMDSKLIPTKATRDAIHIGAAAVHEIDILLTWNCKHIANAAIMKALERLIINCGYEMPILCTPEELIGD